jgi:cell division protein ZapE
MSSLAAVYSSQITDGTLRPDTAQEAAWAKLEAFAKNLHDPRVAAPNILNFWRPRQTAPASRGFYLYGPVGRGKSMLMDLFFNVSPIVKKRRVHFHQIMLEIHDRLHRLQESQTEDILPHLARDIAAETSLLCFDEFHVSNIADAMILGRLFEALFAADVIVIATSNWPPDDLYKNGLQRDRFLPFIDLIKQRMEVCFLDGAVDHRYRQTEALPSIFHPLSEAHTRQLQGIFYKLTGNANPEKINLLVQGRVLYLTHTAKGVGFFNFNELCEAALGMADYLALAENLHTVLLDGVPQMQAEKRNETTRFINLIDALYEAKVKLFMAMAVPLEKLAPEGGELAFAFQRTLSRLQDMQSAEYRQKPHLGV